MFKKLFSQKASGASAKYNIVTENAADSSANNDDVLKQQVVDYLLQYQSSSFPYGLSTITTNIEVVVSNKGIVIHLTIAIPCRGELAIVASELSSKLSLPVRFKENLEVKAVRQHDIANVKNIIAIASGKGGVGKSTTSVNLAYALINEGAKVGILDADIYGPSIPTMLGLKNQKPTSEDGKTMTPLKADKLTAMSIGFLVPESDATVWRGPMASTAFSQLLNETAWPELDYLLIDMPPGTGDIQLTLAQKVPVAAAVIVTTPQDIALSDAKKGIVMFDKVKVPVLGVIENMSYHVCDNCGHHSHLFGEGGGDELVKVHKTTLLGQLPLDISIRENSDAGKSLINENSTSDLALMYRNIARNVSAQLFLQLDSRSPQTPIIKNVSEDSNKEVGKEL